MGDEQQIKEEPQYMSVREASKEWGISEDVVRSYCRDHHELIGALKEGFKWMIPRNACPPIRTDELCEFMEEHLKALERGVKLRGWQRKRKAAIVRFLITAELVEIEEDGDESSSGHGFILTNSGWDFLMGRRNTRKRRFASSEFNIGSFSLISINISPSILGL